MLPAGVVPDGFAIPFSFYDRFMREGGFYDARARIIGDPRAAADPAEREQALEMLRKKMKKAARRRSWREIADCRRLPRGTPIRCRSSTNNEDLEGFNGAGLYDSFTHRPDEGELEDRQAGLGVAVDFRAFDEREFHRIDHLARRWACSCTRTSTTRSPTASR